MCDLNNHWSCVCVYDAWSPWQCHFRRDRVNTSLESVVMQRRAGATLVCLCSGRSSELCVPVTNENIIQVSKSMTRRTTLYFLRVNPLK